MRTRFHLFAFDVNQMKLGGTVSAKIHLPNPSGGKLLFRPLSYKALFGSGVSRALSNICDEAFLQK